MINNNNIESSVHEKTSMLQTVNPHEPLHISKVIDDFLRDVTIPERSESLRQVLVHFYRFTISEVFIFFLRNNFRRNTLLGIKKHVSFLQKFTHVGTVLYMNSFSIPNYSQLNIKHYGKQTRQ